MKHFKSDKDGGSRCGGVAIGQPLWKCPSCGEVWWAPKGGKRMSNETRSINDGDNRRRVESEGRTIGWITTWYERDQLNDTGIKRFSAKPLCGVARHGCETYSSAIAYIKGHWN